ncbi:hypothetical protein WME91_18240 [Sorangium sp. So ce269]
MRQDHAPRALLLALSLSACAGAGPADAPSRPPSSGRPAAPANAPSAAPARWVDSSGATAIGPAVGGGTLVLLGGRRAVVSARGEVQIEAAPSAEPLLELIEVPSASGARRIVGRSAHAVYRLDDPLGKPVPLARSLDDLSHIGGGPGLVAVWDVTSDLPRLIDVETGQARSLPGLPALPLRAVAFRDLLQGAAIFEGAGLSVTSDGGATWRAVAAGAGAAAGNSPADAPRFSGVRLAASGALRAVAQHTGVKGEIDATSARITLDKGEPAPPEEPPMLRWIRRTGRDPLEAAISSGVALASGAEGDPPRVAVAVSHGLLARVDTTTGAILDVESLVDTQGAAVCKLGAAGRHAWVGCLFGDDGWGRLREWSGVRRAPHLGEVRTSPSGGAMLLTACNPDAEPGIACLRQPSGAWITVPSRTDLGARNASPLGGQGAGPLADGTIAIARGLWDGDVPPDDADDAADAGSPALRGPHLAVIDAAGKERPLAALGWTSAPADGLAVVSPIEEGADHALSVILAERGGDLTAVVVPPDGVLVRQRLEGVTHAQINDGHGVAVRGDQVFVSTDAGRSWPRLPVPAEVARALQQLDPRGPDFVAVNAVGLKIGTLLRTGWASAGAAPSAWAPSVDAATLLLRRAPPRPGPEHALVCAAQGAPAPSAARPPQPRSPGDAAPFLSAEDIASLLAGGSKALPPGSDRRRVASTLNRSWVLHVMGLFEEVGGAGAGGKPGGRGSTWTLRWLDPAELHGKIRSWTGPAPKGATLSATMRSVAVSGDRALFALTAAYGALLVLARPDRIETARVPFELVPGSDVVFSEEHGGRGGVIAWMHDSTLVAWVSGEPPRPLASVQTDAARALSTPTRDGVPLILGAEDRASDWALARVVPLGRRSGAAVQVAPAAATAAGATSAGTPAPPLPLDGWAPARDVHRDPSRLPACTLDSAAVVSKGARFLVHRSTLDVIVDDRRALAHDALYDVRVSGGDACVASVAAALGSEWSTPGVRATAFGVHPGRAIRFVRADFLARGAEEGALGPDVEGSPRRLTCALSTL